MSSQVDRSRFFGRWVAWTTAGEAAGFAVAACVGVTVAQLAIAPILAAVALLAAGAVEGAVLGAGQVLALRSLPITRRELRPWIGLTSVSAVVAWSIGLLPGWLPTIDWSNPTAWLAAGVLGLVLLATIPTAQLIALHRIVRRPWRWLPANIIGWLLGIGWTLAVSPLVDAGTSVPRLVALYLAAGIAMALTVATATGVCWLGWLRHGDLHPEGAAR